MPYSRKPMPPPNSQICNEPPSYQEVTARPPPVPRRKSFARAPALPPRSNRPVAEREEAKSRDGHISKQRLDVKRGNIDLSNVFNDTQPPSVFKKQNHELSLPNNIDNNGIPIETNKFYGNLLVGSQTCPIWTHPYSLWWSKDSPHRGIAVTHIKSSQRVFGPGSPPQYFFNPVGIKSFVFSSDNYSDDFLLGLTSLHHMSAQLFLQKNNDQYIHFPLVQGMGFFTAIYHGLVPKLYSSVGFREVQKVTFSDRQSKYRILLENGVTWLLYVTYPLIASFDLILQDGNTLLGSGSVKGCIFQIVANCSETIDSAAGCYPINCKMACSTESDIGNYSFDYPVEGNSISGKTLMFALPHHVNYFSDEMRSQPIVCQLDSTIKGVMNGYITNSFEMHIPIPSSIGFSPFTTISGKSNELEYSPEVLAAIKQASAWEVEQDVVNESNLDSMYFSGKILAKYAWILYCCQFITKEPERVSRLLPKLKAALARFIDNVQALPLKYDSTWGGIVSSGTSSQDFGNSFYNDHHFHYSYHVIAAAILAKVDGIAGNNNWLSQNRSWVETLIRDYANPSEEDRYFPAFRSFDWFNGHSFAKGLFESGDGKDQESSSEDVNASYALKLWGLVTQNQPLIDIANVQLGILKTSVNLYFLYSDDNTVMPHSFIPNKVSGILFENKVDHTTYFGNELQYIQMIHAIPITSISSFIRSPKFVEEEWLQKLAPIANDVKDGWKGIMMLNVALFNPRMSFDFFNSDQVCLDNGQSLTWSLAYSGAFI